jgi:hypothetical protein
VVNVQSIFTACEKSHGISREIHGNGPSGDLDVWGLRGGSGRGNGYKRQMLNDALVFEGAFSGSREAPRSFWPTSTIFSWEVWLSSFDIQDVNGRIADSLYSAGPAVMKPPVQGLAYCADGAFRSDE